MRLRDARGARHASPGACCAGCAISPIVDNGAVVNRAVADRGLSACSMSMPAASTRWTGATGRLIAENFGGGPVGVETIAAALSEPRDAIEDIIEPYLLQQGFLQRTPRGRLLTANAFKHLGTCRAEAGGAAIWPV